jgi:RNA polymerase sigma-70 factor, ECF subfamily
MMDTDLLQGAKQFNQGILVKIYDEYNPRIYRYAMRLLGNADLAEECVSETFTLFLKALHCGKGPQKHLQAYLFRIAHNWIADWYRRQPPHTEILDDELQDEHTENIEQSIDLRIQQKHTRAALLHLTPDQRQVIVLKFLEGWSNREIAEVINKPVGAVKSLQHRALTALRKQLKASEENQE